MKDTALKFYLITFVSALIVANIVASKLVQVGWWIVPAAVFLYPVTFAMTDVISEVWGKKEAKKAVWLGFFANIVMLIGVYLAIYLPPAPFYKNQEAFKTVLENSFRIVLASLLAYLASQTHDVWAFHFWKRVTKGKHLWIRNNASTMASQFIDTAIFIPVAFAGVVPEKVLWTMIVSQYTLKLIIAALDTPVVYLLTKLTSGKWEVREWS